MRLTSGIEEDLEALMTPGSGCASSSRSIAVARCREHEALFLAVAREIADDRLELGARGHLLAHAIGGLVRRAEDGAPLALDLAQERVGEPADDAPRRRDLLRRPAGRRKKLGEVDRLAGAQEDVPVVREKLQRRSHLAGPLARAEEAIEEAADHECPGASARRRPAGARGSGRSLRRCQREERADEVVALAHAASRASSPARHLEHGGRALEKERSRAPWSSAEQSWSTALGRPAGEKVWSQPFPIGSRIHKPRSLAKRIGGSP